MVDTTLEETAKQIEAEAEVIVDSLRSPLQQHIALSHANRLLTNLMGKLRPIRDREPGGEIITRYLANEEGLGTLRVRRLTRMIEDGIAQIEGREFEEARSTFEGLTDAFESSPEVSYQAPAAEPEAEEEARPFRAHSTDRRSNRRTSINSRAGMWHGAKCEQFAIVNLRNISSSGMRIRSDFALDCGERFKVRYAGLLLYGKVVRCEAADDSFDIGAELEGVFLFPSQNAASTGGTR